MKLKIGIINLSFHHVAASVVLKKLDIIGQKYETQTATHEKLFEKYVNGEVHIVLGAWLPSSHGKYISPVKNETEFYSVLYKPYCIWGVPDYVDISAVEHIAKPDIANKFTKTIQGINEGAGISRFSRNIITEYGLDKLGFEFKNGTIPICTEVFEQAYAKKEWVIIPLWEPQYLHHKYNIRALEEPKGLLGTVDESTIIVKKDTASQLPAKVLDIFKNTSLGNKDVTTLDYLFQIEHKNLEEIATEYLSK